MADIANLVLAVDATQVKTGTAALDGLTAAGTRAQAAAVGLGGGVRGAGVAAAAMAAEAQASSRAAMGMATGFAASTNAARLNTIAMRETLVVARELSRGNFTRIPGSLSLLAQNVSGGVSGYINSLLRVTGILKTVQNAELAEEAANAAAAATAVQGAAARASANIMAADTEIALAQAAQRTAVTSEEEAAAAAQLSAAHEAQALAAREAAIAENALAVAEGRAAEAAAANAAATRKVIGGTGIGLIGLGIVAGIAYGAIKRFQDQVRDSGALDQFAASSRLSAEQIEKLGGKVEYTGHNVRTVTGLTVTFGDVMHGVWQEITKESGSSSDDMEKNTSSAFSDILDFWNKTSAAISAGLWTLGDIAKDVFQFIAQKIGQSFYDGVNRAIDAINGLNAKIPKWAGGGDPNLIPHLKSGPPIKDLGSLGSMIRSQADKNYADALAANNAAFAGVERFALQHARDRITKLSDAHNIPKAHVPRQKRNPAEDELAKLDAEIEGQKNLAAAYLISDSAALKAEADQKALTLAVEKHATAVQTAALKEKELALAIATTAASGAKTANNLRFEADTREAVNGMVAAGIIPASQANSELELETQLRPLAAAAALAHGEALANIVEIMSRLTKAHDDLNKQVSEGQALQQIASNDNEIAQLRLKNDLLGHSNKEIATALANLQTMQYLADHPGIDASTAAGLASSNVAKAVANVQSPFQQWAASIPQTADAVNEALQQIEFKGFDNLASAITDVITGTKSLGAAFKDVARSIISDILQMTIRMLIFRAISGMFGGGKTSITPLDGGVMSITTSANGNVFSGGNVIPFATGGVVSSPTLFPMSGGRTGLMGEAGPEAVMPLARDSSGRLGVRAANSNEPTIVEVRLNDEMLQGRIIQGSAAVIRAAAPEIVKTARSSTVKSLTRRRL